MNPPPNSTEQSGGVNFGSGNQAAVNDVIGRDKVVHNHYSPLPTGPQIPKPPGAARLRGRAELLDELAACLPSIPLLALEGLPGVGKSSLALALANHPLVIEQFPHGRLWLEFGPEANVYDLLGRALLLFGQPLEALREQAERQARLQQLLADQQCLLLLDDLWQVGQAQPFLLATSASTRVVITLRRASLAADLGAHIRAVPTLSNPAAQAMLGDGGPSAQQAVAMAPAAATALSKTLGHLPLALHVAARRLNRLAHSRGASGAVARLQAEVAHGTEHLLQLPAAQPAWALTELNLR